MGCLFCSPHRQDEWPDRQAFGGKVETRMSNVTTDTQKSATRPQRSERKYAISCTCVILYIFSLRMCCGLGSAREQVTYSSKTVLLRGDVKRPGKTLGPRPLKLFPLITELAASGFAVELPVDFDAVAIHPAIPGSRFPTQGL